MTTTRLAERGRPTPARGLEAGIRNDSAAPRSAGIPGMRGTRSRAAFAALGGFAILQWLWLGVVFMNHLTSPETTRGTIYESVHRILAGEPLFPAPNPVFLPTDYNPLVYFMQAGASLLFGFSPAVLRLVAVIGTLGIGVLIFLIVRRESGSAWFGVIASGLFAAGYRSFDCYLDYPHPDSWMLCTALAGLSLLAIARTRGGQLGAVLLLCVSFWFKQQGAFLAIGGVLFITWRDGVRRALPCWILAAAAGPLAYLLLGPQMFGDRFLYYTYEVPRAYQNPALRTLLRASYYLVLHWLVLAAASAAAFVRALRRREMTSIWLFTLPFAVLIGILGSMDYSENNVYIAPSIWFIIVGVTAIARAAWESAAQRPPRTAIITAAAVALALAFASNVYDPRSVLVSSGAWRDYDDLITQVRGLDGIVYMPGVGQFARDVRLPIGVHWVALEDLVRGPGRNTAKSPLVREILHQLLEPPGNAYIIAEHPLEEEPMFAFLAPHYELVEDFGDRYRSLRAMPGWYSGNTWPRYLYRYRRSDQPGPPAT